METEERKRLWEFLFHSAEERGADAFSIQPDTSHASSASVMGVEPLMLYLRSVPVRWRWSLRPPAWPLDDGSRRWLRALGTQAFRITLWARKRWVLRTDLWGRTMTVVLPRQEWEGLRKSLEITLGGIPDHSIEKWRSLEPREAGGWAVPKRLRWTLIVAGAVAAGLVIGVMFSWSGGVWAGLAVGLGLSALPQHEPSATDRLIVRTGALTDPGFERRLRIAFNFTGVSVILVIAGGVGVGVSGPASQSRLVSWVLLALGGLFLALGAAAPAAWLWSRRRRRGETPTTSE